MRNSRTVKSAANAFTSILNNILTVVIKFVVRTVFINYLGKEYLGINGLFTSIISMLSLADLGFGIALPYSLYKPLAENNTDRINAIMNFYAKVYRIVGLFVSITGIALTPFLPLIIKDIPDISNINLIYILFVINSAVSYFFVYKKTLIIADQNGYKVKYVESLATLITGVLQILVLIITSNYIVYLLVATGVTIAQNYYVSKIAERHYPYIKDKKKGPLEKNETKALSKNIFAIFMYKIAIVVETSIDNIIISSYIGIETVGIYSNYILIINSVKNILMVAFNSISSSIGNVASEENTEKSFLLFKTIDLISIILYGVCAITIFIMINPFISLWVGDDYIIELPVVLILCFNFYVFGSQNTLNTFRNAHGLFWEGRYRPIVMTLSNLIFSLLLVKPFGLAGIFGGTVISRMLSVGIMDSYVIYKNIFNTGAFKYHFMKFKQGIVLLLIAVFMNYISNFILVSGLLSWLLKSAFISVSSFMLFMLVFWRKTEIKYFRRLMGALIIRIILVFKRRRSNV